MPTLKLSEIKKLKNIELVDEFEIALENCCDGVGGTKTINQYANEIKCELIERLK